MWLICCNCSNLRHLNVINKNNTYAVVLFFCGLVESVWQRLLLRMEMPPITAYFSVSGQ